MSYGTGKNPPAGRVSRLPESLRSDINQKLILGESHPSVLDWLNQHPALQGQPKITTGMFRDYRHGDYARWAKRNPLPRSVAIALKVINSQRKSPPA
jgi:hypothetical protein